MRVTSRFKAIEIFEKSRFTRFAIDSRDVTSIVADYRSRTFNIKLGEKANERKKYRRIGRRALARQRRSGISWARVSILDNNPTRSRQSRERSRSAKLRFSLSIEHRNSSGSRRSAVAEEGKEEELVRKNGSIVARAARYNLDAGRLILRPKLL